MVMEYVPGKTLDALIPRKGMRFNEMLKLAIQMADALSKAHAAGIVHRDMKPSNVMVTDDHPGVTPVYQSGDANSNALLDPGETWTYSASGSAWGSEELC